MYSSPISYGLALQGGPRQCVLRAAGEPDFADLFRNHNHHACSLRSDHTANGIPPGCRASIICLRFPHRISASGCRTPISARPNSPPLLHLWSLGVEIQFYLLVPLLFLLAKKFRHFVPVALMLSFIACVDEINRNFRLCQNEKGPCLF
jgi:hypothetical protein